MCSLLTWKPNVQNLQFKMAQLILVIIAVSLSHLTGHCSWSAGIQLLCGYARLYFPGDCPGWNYQLHARTHSTECWLSGGVHITFDLCEILRTQFEKLPTAARRQRYSTRQVTFDTTWPDLYRDISMSERVSSCARATLRKKSPFLHWNGILSSHTGMISGPSNANVRKSLPLVNE